MYPSVQNLSEQALIEDSKKPAAVHFPAETLYSVRRSFVPPPPPIILLVSFDTKPMYGIVLQNVWLIDPSLGTHGEKPSHKKTLQQILYSTPVKIH